jgi:hypothetical protein
MWSEPNENYYIYLFFDHVCIIMMLRTHNTIRIYDFHVQELERRIAALNDENRMLKDAIFHICCEPHGRRSFHHDVLERLHFYHAHKEQVATTLCASLGITRDQLAWSSVKKETDRMWEALRNPQRSQEGGASGQAQW